MDPSFDSLWDEVMTQELAAAWADANWRYFGRRMTAPVLRLADVGSTLGTWSPRDRTLSLTRSFAREAPWSKIVEVLHHEMAHQYVSEVLGITDETAHGPAFRSLLAAMGHDVHSGGDVAESPVLAKVRKLFALAGSPNRHEAEAAMKAAHRLMLAHNLDVASARQASGYAVRTIGPARVRRDAWEKLLVGLLSRHFFVRVIWVPDLDTKDLQFDRYDPLAVKFRRRTIAECVGTPSNLEIAAWVYDFVVATGERMWKEHKAARGVKGDAQRRRYLSGLVTGFSNRLAESAAACASEGLVWKGDPGVEAFYGKRNPRVKRTSVSVRGGEAYRHGEADGRTIVLHKPIRTSGTGGGSLTG